MRFIAFFLMVLGILAVQLVNTVAGEYDGWCFPYNECMDNEEPISNNSFEMCESTCVMENPVEVRDMSATLYDVTCKGDWGSRKKRMFFIKLDNDGTIKALAVDRFGAQALTRCQ